VLLPCACCCCAYAASVCAFPCPWLDHDAWSLHYASANALGVMCIGCESWKCSIEHGCWLNNTIPHWCASGYNCI
jgi:hypothetical protein